MARGSIRQRGRGRWELRVDAGVDAGVDAATGRQRDATRTVHGSRRASVRALDDLALEVDNARSHAGTGVIAFTRALVVGPDGPVLGATKTDATHCTDLDAESAQVLRRCQCGCPATSGDSPCRCPVRPTCSRMTSTAAGRGHRTGPPSSSSPLGGGRSASLPAT
jgi:hypothetical protein